MHHSIAYLEQSLQVLVNNEPISRAECNIDQADLEKVSAEEIRDAIEVLKNHYLEQKRPNDRS